MGLIQLTDRICYLPHDPEEDRPMLAYVRGDQIDAGHRCRILRRARGGLLYGVGKQGPFPPHVHRHHPLAL